MADAKVTSLSEVSVPALEDLTYWVDDPAGTPASAKASMTRALALIGTVPGGRLTLTTGVPVTTSDVTAAGTLYYTPYLHDKIRIYDGTRWRVYTFTERSLSLTLTSGKNYDVFIYDNAGTLTLELSAAWTNDTTRADALTTQDGVKVKSGATTRLWLGTIRASGSNTTEDSGGGSTTQVGGKRFVWNAYNQVPRDIKVIDTTDNWSYTSATWRQENGAPGNKVEFVVGDVAGYIDAQYHASLYVYASNQIGTRAAAVGLGLDSTTSPTGVRQGGFLSGQAAGVTVSFYSALGARYTGYPGLGHHYIAPLERGEDVVTLCLFIGDNGGDGQQTGLFGTILA